MKEFNIAVAMSVYDGDSPIHLKEALESVLIQKGVNLTVFIQIDGKIGKELNAVVIEFESVSNINIAWNDNNKGLAKRLNQIIETAIDENAFDFLARMDADDICESDRFIKQAVFLSENRSISVVGSDVIEISESGETLFYKKMDKEHNVLSNKIIKKCPFNHPSVMFNMSVFIEGFRYKSELKNTQDYYLWVDLLAAGKTFANINEPLLKFRINDSFHSRRGFKKAMNDLRSRLYAFKHLNVLTIGNMMHTALLFILRLSPSFVKKSAYKFLR